MRKAWLSCTKGLYPSHHLWGAFQLPELGLDVDVLEYQKFPRVTNYWRLQRLLGLNQLQMIALEQQIRTLAQGRFDVVYSACQDHTHLLSQLRRFGIFRKPIVSTLHHPPTAEQLVDIKNGGHDKFIVLSDTLHRSLVEEYSINSEILVKIDWGPDIAFYRDYVPPLVWDPDQMKPVLISAGKSNRDYKLLVDAIQGIDCQLRIYGSSNSLSSLSTRPKNVLIKSGGVNTNAISYPAMVEAYKNAQIIVIPLIKVDKLAGLTSLMDVLAVGRPVIMTKNPYLDIDIEREGIGLWVDPGDTKGWQLAINKLVSNPVEAAQMGARARKLCVDRYNIDRYAGRLVDVVSDLFSTIK